MIFCRCHSFRYFHDMSNGILPPSDESLHILSLKHPEAQQAHHEAILQSPKRQIHSIVYEDIDKIW